MAHEHISRKELKADEIRETIVHGAEVALSHQKQLWIYGGGILAVVLLVFGWRLYSERQDGKAWVAFEEANKVFQARIRAAGEPEQPGEVSFFDERIKFEEAAKQYASVSGQYSRTRAGKLSKYYTGLSYERVAKYDDAQKWLKQAEAAGDSELSTLARFQQAHVLVKTGKGEEAVKLYQALMAAPSTMVSKALVMMTLADFYRKAKPAEAQKLYTQIRTEFPDTEMARRAQERLEMLGQS